MEAHCINIDEILSFEIINQKIDVYDIEIEDNHNFLLQNGIIVHNSGKSFAGVLKTVAKKLKYPQISVAYYLPTYGLIRDIAFPKFTELLIKQGIEFQLNKSDKEFITSYGRIIMRSMDNPDLIVGYEVGYSCIDEADTVNQLKMNDCFKNIVARNRSILPNGDQNQLDFVSTPEGYGFIHNFFEVKKHQNKKLIKASTLSNPFVSDSYIETLRMNYTANQLKAYLDGDFVNINTGSVFNQYSRQINATTEIAKSFDTLHIGIDFNITKMSAVIHIFANGNLYAVDEIVNAYDTVELCELIKSKFGTQRINVYPDASGANRKSNSSETDIQILKNYNFTVVKDNTNPRVEDRITAVNVAFKNSLGVSKYFVNDLACVNYSQALERLAYAANNTPDKTSGYDHVTDAGTYCAYHFFKIVNKTYKTSIRL